MGNARRKKLAGFAPAEKSAEERRAERERRNRPHGRRGWRPMLVELLSGERAGERYEVLVDGSVYTVGAPRRRVREPALIEEVRRRGVPVDRSKRRAR